MQQIDKNAASRRAGLMRATAIGFMASTAGIATAQEARSNSPIIEEVVVTVNKREQQIQDVPSAVTALGGADLAEQQILEVRDLNGRVPGLAISSSSGRGAAQVFLRGVGSVNFNPETASAIGMYQDEVYYNTGLTEPYFDIERVEIARGPQGTLFGKNTTGGAINVITRKPTADPGGYVNVSYGRFNQLDIEGAGGAAIIDGTLSGRVAATRQSRDGYITNTYDGKELGRYVDDAVRAQLRWTPTDGSDILLKVHARSLDGNPAIYRHVPTRASGTDAYGYRFTGDIDEVELNVSDPATSVRQRGVQITGNFDVGFADLVTILSNDQSESLTNYDDDGSPNDVERSRYDRGSEQSIIEARLVSSGSGPLSWIVGYHFFTENLTSLYQYISQEPSFPFGIHGDFTQDTRSDAVYANLQFKLSDQLTLIGGGRYTRETKEAELTGLSYNPDPLDPFNPFITALPPTVTSAQDDKKRWEEPTYDLTLQYQPTADLNIYAKYAHGFRAGGFNSGAYNQAAVTTVDPELLDAYELGAKTNWADGRVTFNTAVYYYDFSDRQTFQYQGTTPVLVNAGTANFTGADVELVVEPITDLSFAISAGVVKAEIGGYNARGPDGVVRPVDTDDTETNVGAVADYLIPLAIGELRLHTDWTYRSENNLGGYVEDVGLGPEWDYLKEDPYWLGNVQITLAPTDKFEVSLWGRNVTDERRRTTSYILFSGVGGIILTDPATYGVSVRTRF